MIVENYYQLHPEVKVVKKRSEIQITIKINGFRRIRPSLILERTFALLPKRLSITDTIHGDAVHLAETFFHFAPGVEINNMNNECIAIMTDSSSPLVLKTDFGSRPSMRILKAEKGKKLGGWFFPLYGREIPTNTLIYSQHSKLPLQNRYVLSQN